MIQGNGLRDAYSATVERIRAQEGGMSRLGMEALMWLSHSKRPLSANELCHALGIELGSIDPDPRNIPAIEILLGCSLGLVTLEASSQTLRLVHYTLQEYLSENADLFQSPHLAIAEVCLTYLNFQCIRCLSPTHNWSPHVTPLLEYASCCWGEHARGEITASVNTLALRLLDGFDKHVSSRILLSDLVFDRTREFDWRNPAGFTGLHYAAYFGMVEIAGGLLNTKKWDLEVTDMGGNTAILWAARKGHGAIVKLLSEQEGVTPNTADKGSRTPLSWAAGGGFGNIVKMLLGRGDVTPNTTDKGGRTPLSWAIRGGSEERGDVTLNTADKKGGTPLPWGIRRGSKDVVKIPPEREDVAANIADVDGRTPFLLAIQSSDEGIVKILLERGDVALSTADRDGITPLLLAVRLSDWDIVKVLLERGDIALNTADRDGRTPLLLAAKKGYRRIAKMLLDRDDIDTMIRDNCGRTPLSWAEENEHLEIVKMLLKRRTVSQDIMIPKFTSQASRERTVGGAVKR